MARSRFIHLILGSLTFTAMVATGAVLGTPTNGVAQEGTPVERMAADWKSRNQQFVSARYRIRSKVTVKRGEYNEVGEDADLGKVYPEQDHVYDREVMLLADFVAEKMRWEIHDQIWNDSLKKFRPSFRIMILDGSQLSIYRPPAANTSQVYKPSAIQPELVTKSAIKDFHTPVPLNYRPVLFGHGFVLPAQAKPPSQPAIIPAETAASFITAVNVIDVGPKQVMSAKMEVPGSTFGGDEFRVQVEHGFPIVGWTIFGNDQPWLVFDITYEDTPQGAFPKRWIVSRMANGAVANSTISEVVSRELNVAVTGADFEVKPRPSAVVIKDGQFFQADAQGKSLVKTSPAALTQKLAFRKRYYWSLAIALPVAAIACVLAVRHWYNRFAR